MPFVRKREQIYFPMAENEEQKINLFKCIRDTRRSLHAVVKKGEPGCRPAHNT